MKIYELLQMMRHMDFTHQEFADKLGVSVRTFDRYIANGVPKRIENAAKWVYLKEMNKEFVSTN